MGLALVGLKKRALVTGVLGQDGSYLAELLLLKGYEVFGLGRVGSRVIVDFLNSLSVDSFHMIEADIRSADVIADTLRSVRPAEIYNLAAQTNVGKSFAEPELTHDVNFGTVSNMLEAIVASQIEAKFYQASSSEMFGLTPPPQNESSSFLPQSPYAVAKTVAHELVSSFRAGRGVFAVSGIAFNHESPRRPTSFVSRKISASVASISRGESNVLHLGNIDVTRDWGYAPEYVEAMWRSLQQDEPDDYVFASGTGHTVREFAEFAFDAAGLDWRDYVVHDETLERTHDTKASIGDPSRAREKLGWSAQITTQELARIMVEHDLQGSNQLDLPPIGCWS